MLNRLHTMVFFFVSLILLVGNAGAAVVVTSADLPGDIVNTSYSTTLVASGGTGPYTWSLISGSLPTGLNLSSGGIISGTPIVLGDFQLIIQACDTLSVCGVSAPQQLWIGVYSGTPPYPTPPSVFIDTTWSAPVGGTTWTPHTAADFQTALNSANPGDTIVLDVEGTTTYTGNFTIPVKTNLSNKWIYIESAGYASLPAPGTRIDPSNAPYMAKIVSPNAIPAITLNPSANYIRLVGLEVTTISTVGQDSGTVPPTNGYTYYLIYGPVTDGVPGNLMDHITIDRCYIHGSDTEDSARATSGNGTYFAVIDSYLSDIHMYHQETQTILTWQTPGPIKIVNNFLSAAGEVVMFGGAGNWDNPYVPSDIEIRNNHFFLPLTWDKCGVGGTLPSGYLQPNGVPCPPGLGFEWVVKNILEFKSGQRVIVSGNILENSWVSGQTGYGLDVTAGSAQAGNIAVTDDIEAVGNILQNVDQGISTLEQDYNCGDSDYPLCTNQGEVKRIWVHNNLILLSSNLDIAYGNHMWLAVDGGALVAALGPTAGLTDFIFQHNTAMMIDGSDGPMRSYVFNLESGGSCTPSTSPTHNLWFLDNAIARQPDGACGTEGITGLNYYMGDPSPLAPRYLGNLMFAPSGDSIQTWPPRNDVATSWTFDSNNVLLTPNWSAYTSDGTQAGWNGGTELPLTIITTSLPSGTVGVPYSVPLIASGGTGPYTWSVVSGGLPMWATLTGGTIAGTPTVQGTSAFTVQVQDSTTPTPQTQTQPLSITISRGAVQFALHNVLSHNVVIN